MITLVTSLHDIGRKELDGRDFSQYLDWFSTTLKLNANFVVFGPSSLKSFVYKSRPSGLDTLFIEEPLEESSYYKYKSKMDEVLQGEDFKKRMSDILRIECKSSLYSIVQYSKFGWMEKASEINEFDSEYFIWVDAGLSRFFDDLNILNKYPGKRAEEVLLEFKEKILIQVFSQFYPDLFHAKELSEDYFYDNRSYVMGGMFGGGRESIIKINKIVEEKFKENLNKNIVNNEQIMLGYLYKKYPELFVSCVNKPGHRSYELIHELSVQ